jgi:hypothetical protein
MMLEKLRQRIDEFIKKHDHTIYKVRILIKEGGKNPFGIRVNGIIDIQKYDPNEEKGKNNKLPKQETIVRLLDHMEVRYKLNDLGGIIEIY